MITVGVTGHRRLAEIDRVRAGVVEALNYVKQNHPGEVLTVLSSLAEGADTLVAQVAMNEFGGRLVVPLPLPCDEYLMDFASATVKQNFLDLLSGAAEVVEAQPTEDRNQGYEAAGIYVLDHCNVLLAIWDGKVAQGRGGTGQIVSEARRRGLPVAWVHAGNRLPGTDTETSLNAEQGKVEFENF